MDILKEAFTLQDLFDAYFDCRRRKRNTKNAIDFELNLEQNLMDLYHELKNGTYKIGQSICFVVTKPKPREVWAANFRDRVVHHLVYNAIKDRFHKRFIKDTYSCIPERGTLAAAKRLAQFTRSITQNHTKKAYYLKADLSNFFVSIDKNVLFKQLEKHISEKWILDLVHQIVFNDPRQTVYIKSSPNKLNLIPRYKSLLHSPFEKSLPIGNLTSQFFSNVYLDALDQYVKHTLGAKYYCRYVDDFVILHEDTKVLNDWFHKIDDFLQDNLQQRLHSVKKLVNKISVGIDFVGFVLKPGRIFLRQHTIKNIFRTLKNHAITDSHSIIDLRATINSYLGMFKSLQGFLLRRKLCQAAASIFLGYDEDCSKLRLLGN